jgi:hypothetical protein
MDMQTFGGGVVVAVAAVLVAILHVGVGVRVRRSDVGASRAFFVVALVALGIAGVVLLRMTSSIVGYGLLCLVLVSRYFFDLVHEERTRRRRVASLVPRAAAEAVPSVWVAIAVASLLMLVPYVVVGEQRAAALVVGVCAFVMAGIAWRIASAPVQLYREDVRYERLRDRAARARKAGMAAVVALGTVFAFIAFVNPSAVLAVQRPLLFGSFLVWAGLWAWVIVYAHRLDRLAGAAS